MTIKVGDKLPDASFTVMTANGPAPKSTSDVFAGKKVALFAVPGAYTPTCYQQHVPGFVDRVDELKKKGVDVIACTAVNDIFVLTQFAKDTKADRKILMLADGNADFPIEALCHAGRQRRGEDSQCGGRPSPARQV
jgi:peroxiredoxin